MQPLSEVPMRVAIAVVQHKGRFLVGVRPDNVPLAGLAEFPGGKVGDGETPQQAAVRECWEETGLLVRIVGEYLCCVHRYDHGLLEIYFFDGRIHGDASTPRTPFHWVPADALASLAFPEANAPLTKLLLDRARTTVAGR